MIEPKHIPTNYIQTIFYFTLTIYANIIYHYWRPQVASGTGLLSWGNHLYCFHFNVAVSIVIRDMTRFVFMVFFKSLAFTRSSNAKAKYSDNHGQDQTTNNHTNHDTSNRTSWKRRRRWFACSCTIRSSRWLCCLSRTGTRSWNSWWTKLGVRRCGANGWCNRWRLSCWW